MKKLIKTYNISFMYNFFVDLRKRAVKVWKLCSIPIVFLFNKNMFKSNRGHRAYRGVQKSLITF